MINEIVKKITPQMDVAIANFESELKNIRTGRASSAIVEDVIVSYYGTSTPLKQLASITVPESSVILISPWDRQSLVDIENALRTSGLNLPLSNDGSNIRINLPPLTGERREELSKMAQKIAENSKISLRNIRGEAWEEVQRTHKNKQISEDEKYTGEKMLNDLIGAKNKIIEEKLEAKISELKII